MIVTVKGLRKAGRNYKALCPFHEERTPSFNVNPERGGYRCFGCDAAGKLLDLRPEDGEADVEA